ncbi:hypothetical protein E1200_26280, partial [Actinomadura sp. GC306]|uniref:DsbA family protein n=1 Tax=Actinomadura sp. GC306 TaxID=2530367 RepID=UPI00104ABCD4
PGPYGPPPPPRGGNGCGVGLVIGLLAGGLVLVLAVAAVFFIVVQEDEGGGDGGGVQLRTGKIAGGAEAVPQRDGSLEMARPGVTSPVVEIFVDFACPHCGDFDRKNDPMLKELAVAGKAKVVFRPMVIFAASRQPAHGNSVRAAAALRCVGDGAHWLSYQDALYTKQPAGLETEGYRKEDLLLLAHFRKSEPGFMSCVTEQRFARSVQTVSQGYIDSGIRATPSVRLNGSILDQSDIESPESLRRAIESAS